MAIETVSSPLLSDPPAVPQPKDRPADDDFTKTVAAGYVESLAEFGARMDLRRAALLNGAVAAASVLLLALGRHLQTGGHRA